MAYSLELHQDDESREITVDAVWEDNWENMSGRMLWNMEKKAKGCVIRVPKFSCSKD